ncbi:hypothetical protein ACHAWF_016950 [Thalassiosira exigua]
MLSIALIDARLVGTMDGKNRATANLQKEKGCRRRRPGRGRRGRDVGPSDDRRALSPRNFSGNLSLALVDARLMGTMNRDDQVAVAKLQNEKGHGLASTPDDSSAAKTPKHSPENHHRRALLTKSSSLPKSFACHFEFPSNIRSVKHLVEKPAKKKALGVRFSTEEAEVHRYEFDRSLAGDVFYTRCELEDMDRSRYTDAAMLRERCLEDERGSSEESTRKDVRMLLAKALSDDDRDDAASTAGIEHFVYPELRTEMIQRKDELRREVLSFAHSKRPDPQGWRLAQHSRTLSQWAQDVAQEKGMRYRVGNDAAYDDEEEAVNSEDMGMRND